MESLSLIVGNVVNKVRRETLNGRAYLVASSTSIVPGVLPGSKGPLLYTPDVFGKDPGVWNGIALTMFHPTDGNGNNVSAKDGQAKALHRIGRVRNSVWDGKLTNEAWFNVEKTRAADDRFGTDVLNRLERGLPIELSTGLYTENDDTSGTHDDGRYYVGVVKNFRPDHLAVLPNQVGACSLRDGCGINVNRTCAACGMKPTVNELAGDAAEKVTFLSKLAGWLGVSNVVPRHPPTGRYQGHAKVAAKKGFAHTGTTTVDTLGETDDEEDEEQDLDEPTVENATDTTTNEETIMGLTAEAKKAHVDFLVANCDCWKGDGKTLNGFPDEKLVKLRTAYDKWVENEKVVNQLRTDMDMDLNLVTTNAIPAFIKKKMDSKKVADDADDSSVVDTTKNKKVATANAETVTPAERPLTERLTPAELAVWNVAVDVERQTREALVANIQRVADAAKNPARKAAILNELKTRKDVRALESYWLSIQPDVVANVAPPAPTMYPSYLGAAGAADVAVANRSSVGDDPMETLNFETLAVEERARKTA